jgi:hypothetical protein
VKQRVPFSAGTASEKLPPATEEALIAAAGRLFRGAFPNTERSGCPSRDLLVSVSRHSATESDSRRVLDHLSCCSPCFGDYEKLARQNRLARNLKLLALCASLLFCIGVTAWYYSRVPEQQPQAGPSVAKEPVPPPQPQPLQLATLDLRGQTTVRGEQRPTAGTDVPTIPARNLELSVYLPLGSEEGDYEMQLLSEPERPLLSQTGAAALAGNDVVLRLVANLSSVEPGTYTLRLRRSGFSWRNYSIVLTK